MTSPCVLVVEDDPALRLHAATILEEAGFHVVELETGDDALGYLVEQSGAVAAIFTDVHMPGDADGLYLADTVARTWPGIRVLVTSGRRTAPPNLPRNVRFLPKPWLPAEVLSAMEGSLTLH